MMVRPNNSKVTWLLIGGATCALGAGTWVMVARSGTAVNAGVPVPEEYSKEALKAKMAEGPGGFGVMREAMEREDLTEEQRRQIGENARSIFRERMEATVNEYFSAETEDEKNAVLDQQIDQFQDRPKITEEQRKEWEKRREERRAEGGARPEPTQQERKERSESRNPDQMARQMAYFSAVEHRATERGIKMPGPGPGGPGGFGGPGRGGRGP
jgi:uncharacterized protein YdaU (DUF1376 family)